MNIPSSTTRDYMAEMEVLVQTKPDNVQISELMLWLDHMPNLDVFTTSNGPAAESGKIEQLNLESVQKAYEADALKLSHDMARFSEYQSKVEKTDRKTAIARVLHTKNEHKRGASMIVDFMNRNCRIKSNEYDDEHFCITEVSVMKSKPITRIRIRRIILPT